ncbi:hypothetical protein DMENIID0001_134520 [Sergentomyia squamirostris]
MGIEGVSSFYLPSYCCSKHINTLIRSQWSAEGVKVLVIYDHPGKWHKSCWEGFLSVSDMEKKAKDLEIPLDDVIRTTERDLFALSDVRMRFEIEEGISTLTWLPWFQRGEVTTVELKQLEDNIAIKLYEEHIVQDNRSTNQWEKIAKTGQQWK